MTTWLFSTVCNGEITVTVELTAEQMIYLNNLAEQFAKENEEKETH